MNLPCLRIGFAGSPDAACLVLQALLDADTHRVVLVLTRPDRPRGRGRRLGGVPVRTLAEARHLPLLQPEDIATVGPQLRTLDVLVVVAYGQRLPDSCLWAPRLGCINLHFSLLPRWRGAAPVQHALLQGDTQTGVSVFQIDAGMDTGPILQQLSVTIAAGEDAATLLPRLSRIGADCLLQVIDALALGRACPQAQDERLATRAPRISRQQAGMDWHRPALVLERMVRAYNPEPMAHAVVQGTALRVWAARAMHPAHCSTPGTILDAGPQGLDIAAGEQTVLRLLHVQPAGRKPMSAADFVNGRPEFRQSA